MDQFDLRYLWPVNTRWTVVSRLKYSLDDNELLEALAGLEYESCCWGLRLVARRYLRSRSGDERDALYLELNLKGRKIYLQWAVYKPGLNIPGIGLSDAGAVMIY